MFPELTKCISLVPAHSGLPKLTGVPHGGGMLYSLYWTKQKYTRGKQGPESGWFY